MAVISMSAGESLADLLQRSGNLINFNSGIWLIQEGSLQKRALKPNTTASNILDDYAIVNIYCQGDYFMGDSDMKIDYFALEDSIITQVNINQIDSAKLLFQLDSLEELIYCRSYNDRDETRLKLPMFLTWICKKLQRSDSQVFNLLSQEEIGKLVGFKRQTVSRKLSEMLSTSVQRRVAGR